MQVEAVQFALRDVRASDSGFFQFLCGVQTPQGPKSGFCFLCFHFPLSLPSSLLLSLPPSACPPCLPSPLLFLFFSFVSFLRKVLVSQLRLPPKLTMYARLIPLPPYWDFHGSHHAYHRFSFLWKPAEVSSKAPTPSFQSKIPDESRAEKKRDVTRDGSSDHTLGF